MAVSLIGGGNHRPVESHWQTLSHNVVSSTPHLSGIRTHNVSGDRHWSILSRNKLIIMIKSLNRQDIFSTISM